MKSIFTLILVLFTFVAVYAQTPIPIVNTDFEDLTEMAKNSNNKWAIKGFFLTDVLLTPPGNYVNDANSGLAPGQGDGGSQAFKVAVVQPDATSNSTYQVVALSTEPLDISNREFGRYTHKFYLKPGEPLNAKRPFTYTYIITDANGADVTAFTSTVDDAARQVLNANSDFKAVAAIAAYQPLYSIVDIKASTNTDPLLGSVLNAKYITFQFNIGKNINLTTTTLTNTYYFDNFTLTGPAEVITSVNDYMLNDRVKMYPNPVSDIMNINIEGTNNKTFEVVLYNSLGIVLKREKLDTGNSKIDVSAFQPGVYHATIMSNGNVEWKGSFVKNK